MGAGAWPKAGYSINVCLFGGWGQEEQELGFSNVNSISGNLQTIQMWNLIFLVLILGGKGENNLIESSYSSPSCCSRIKDRGKEEARATCTCPWLVAKFRGKSNQGEGVRRSRGNCDTF